MRRVVIAIIGLLALGAPWRLMAAPNDAVILALLERDHRLAGAEGPPPAAALGDSAVRAAQLGSAFDRYLERRAAGTPVASARRVAALAHVAGDLDPRALAVVDLQIVDALGGWTRVRKDVIPPPPLFAAAYVNASGHVAPAPTFSVGTRVRAEASTLARRLRQSGDLAPEPEVVDPSALEQAVRRFQSRHGIAADGVAGPRTLVALNEPAEMQLRRLARNLARDAAQEPRPFGRRVEINIPAYELRLIEGDRTIWQSRVVVGDDRTPTPLFDDRIRFIELNPSWYVPDSITDEILDKERRQPGSMAADGFVWRDGGKRLKQRPGPRNALGRVKFLFPNHHAVYIHDTPSRGAFARSQRTLSHGCIRLEHPLELAAHLLASQGWDHRRLDRSLTQRSTRRVALDQPVPVYLDYRTAWVDDDGRLQQRPDIYGFDARDVVELPGKGLPAEPPAPPSLPLAPEIEPPPVTASVGPGSG